MENRVKQFYQVTFLGETSELLTPEEFAQLQKECKEIYEYGKTQDLVIMSKPGIEIMPEILNALKTAPIMITRPDKPDVKPELTVPDPVIEAVPGNREKLLEKSAHKGIQEVVKTAMAVDALKERVDKMEPSNTKKDIAPYVKMHEDGVDMLAIKNQMIKDELCAMNSLPYFAKKILAASTRVTKIEQIQESDEAKINRLKALNRAEAKERQSPKVTAKFEKEIVD